MLQAEEMACKCPVAFVRDGEEQEVSEAEEERVKGNRSELRSEEEQR